MKELRMRRMRGVHWLTILGSLLGWSIVAFATDFGTASPHSLMGTLASGQTATGQSANRVRCDESRALHVTYTITAGTATIEVNQQLAAAGAGIRLVGGTSSSASSVFHIFNPAGFYTTNVTACTGCTISAFFQCTPPLKEGS